MEVIKEKMNHKQEQELKQEIQSEKQRMDREQEIRVPYHKPKQYSLKEFLARKSLLKPSIEQLKEQKPANSIMAMKMSPLQLEQFAQKLKEREDEAIEFFKSESESDEEEENKENIDIKPEAQTSDDMLAAETLPLKLEDSENCAMEAIPLKDEIPAEPTKTEEIPMEIVEPEIQPEEEEEKPIVEDVSEDPELDRLREKYANIEADEKKEVKVEEEEDKKPQIHLSTLAEMKGTTGKDVIIDLETGTIAPRQLTGPEMLFQKYLKSVQKPKHKSSIAFNILSIENGKLENQKVQVKLDKELEIDHSRPGVSHEKLKENLRNQIVHKRLGELKKKIEEDAKEAKDELELDEKSDCGMDDDEEDDSDCEDDDEGNCDENEEITPTNKTVAAEIEQPIEDAEDDSNSDEESSSEEEEEVTAGPKKGRILKAFVDSDEEESKQQMPAPKVPTNSEAPSSEIIVTTQDLVDAGNYVPSSLEFDTFRSEQNSDDPFSSQPCKLNNLNVNRNFSNPFRF